MYMTTVRLASPGPPLVRMYGESKIWKALMSPHTIEKNRTGVSEGSVT